MPPRKKYTNDLCNGPLLKQIIFFTLPVIGSLLLQLGFNAADFVVVGRYASHQALAAVGATHSFTSLMVAFLIGFSVGGSVLVARLYGANDKQQLTEAVHTTMLLSIIGGITMMLIGLAISRPLLILLKTPKEILPLSLVYIRIILLGMPFNMVFNFGNAILKAAGDTKRPLFYLGLSGVINLLLNLYFVIVLHMNVAGVATATIISQGISAALIWYTLAATSEIGGLHVRKLRLRRHVVNNIFSIGVPSAFQSTSFGFANLIIAACINSFGQMAIAGNVAAQSIESFISVASNAFNDSSLNFTGQNLGGKKYSRVRKSLGYNLALAFGIVFVVSLVVLYFGRELLSVFNPNPEIIEWGFKRLKVMLSFYFTGSLLNVCSGTLRGSGHATASFLTVFFGACVFRVLWIIFVFPHYRTYQMLLACFPISWLLISIVDGFCLFLIFRHLPKNDQVKG
ncbi:MAG: MATE family efflux transporter [Victivallales bacterium]|nr:MATE family efflux transporter [Victivallales bacterium]